MNCGKEKNEIRKKEDKGHKDLDEMLSHCFDFVKAQSQDEGEMSYHVRPC